MRRPRASRADIGRMADKLRRSLQGSFEAEPNLFVASPLAIPLPGLPLADRANAAVLAAWIRRLCRRHDLRRPLLWSFLPTASGLLGRLQERLVVYHCVDEYSAFTDVPREALIRMERELVGRADIVIVSSQRLLDERRALNPNSHFVSHGVDVRHFSAALDPGTEVPEDLRSLKRPVIGFFGLVADWIDLPLLRSLALARPDWSLAIIGKANTDIDLLRGVANIHLIGHRPYAALPAYCKGIDVGVIPFVWNDLTIRANPLKLREYLAAGLPVVSTPLPEVRRYRRFVRLAYGLGPVIEQIEAALLDRSEAERRRRVDAMRVESWEARVEEISGLVQARMGAAA